MLDDTYIDPLIGETVSQYDVVAKLGGGGMGVVYKATDTKLGRPVALKFLPPQWSHDEGAKQRFVREAQAASATNHPNICVIHNIEQTGDGRLFIVMAYYEGQTLKQKLEAGALPIGDALEIAAEVAEGLAKAHAQGVVHRDVKPGNLIVTDDGVKILDFGLAKFANSLQLTMPGSTVGTVAYMSPEQARGEEADPRSDVWALGVVLYEMLTGDVPFKGAYAEATFHAIKNEPVPALSAPGRDIPAAVEALVLRALEKDPDRRYQSARELARDLRLLQGRTIPLDLRTEALPPLPSLPQAQPVSWWRRIWNGVTVGRAVAAGAAIVLAILGTTYWLSRPVVRIPVAVAPVANHTGDPQLDPYRLALTETLVEELSDSPNVGVVSYPRLIEILRRFMLGAADISSREAIQAIAASSGARFVIVPILGRRGDAWVAQAEVRNAETGTTAGIYETDAVTSSLPKETAFRLVGPLADGIQQHFKTNGPGRSFRRRPVGTRFQSIEAARAFEDGLNAYEQLEYASALAAFRRAADGDSQHATTRAWLSRVLLALGRNTEAVEAARRAKQLVTPETPKADASFIEATLAESQKDLAPAEAQYRRLGVLDPDDAAAQLELGDFFKRQDRNQEAVDAYHAVLRLDAGYIRPRVELCQLYTRLEERPLAEEQARDALGKYRAAGDRAGEAQGLLCLGEAQREQGGQRLVEARRNIEAARDIFGSLGQAWGLSRVFNYLGNLADSEGNYVAATTAFEEALTRSRQVGNRQIEGLALMNLGVANYRLGQRAQAIQYFQQSRDFYEQLGDERRAAEQETNAANLQINYGSDQDRALAAVGNARATFHKLGYVDFEVVAMQVQAAAYSYAGRPTESRRQLLEALSIATERKLRNRIVSLNFDIAASDLLLNEYESARVRLEGALASDAGRNDLKTRIALGTVYTRLGDFETAKAHLEQGLADVRAKGQMEVAPTAEASLGGLAYESGDVQEARDHFSTAAARWTDDLPDAASVEARSYLALLNALTRHNRSARQQAEASVEQAKRMGRLDLEVRCRVNLARVHIAEHRYGDALAVLNQIRFDGDRMVGPELQAGVHYWRSRAIAGVGDPAEASSEAAAALKSIKELQASLPAPYRERFTARTEIRTVFALDAKQAR